MDCSLPGFPVPHDLLEFAQVHVHWFGDTIQPSHPLMFPSPSAFNFLQHQGLSNELPLCIRWPKCWSFSISPSNECSGLISFKIDLFDLLAVQGILRSLLQHHSSKASTLWRSAFFMVQLSHPCMTTGKSISLDDMDLCPKGHLCFLALMYSFPNFEPVPCPVLTVASPALNLSQHQGLFQWVSSWHPLPFLNPACISGSSWFMYYWSLAWRILRITLLQVKWAQLYQSWNILWHCLSFLIGMKTDLFQSCDHCSVFQICWYIECRTSTASSFTIWNSCNSITSIRFVCSNAS